MSHASQQQRWHTEPTLQDSEEGYMAEGQQHPRKLSTRERDRQLQTVGAGPAPSTAESPANPEAFPAPTKLAAPL